MTEKINIGEGESAILSGTVNHYEDGLVKITIRSAFGEEGSKVLTESQTRELRDYLTKHLMMSTESDTEMEVDVELIDSNFYRQAIDDSDE